MAVSDHRPESKQRWSRDSDAQLRQISLQKSLDELSPPGEAVIVRACKEGQWKSSPIPMAIQGLRSDFIEAEPGYGNSFDPPGKGFRGLTEQFRRSAAENQKSRGQWFTVGQHTQHLVHTYRVTHLSRPLIERIVGSSVILVIAFFCALSVAHLRALINTSVRSELSVDSRSGGNRYPVRPRTEE